jgi:hypothetical protein
VPSKSRCISLSQEDKPEDRTDIETDARGGPFARRSCRTVCNGSFSAACTSCTSRTLCGGNHVHEFLFAICETHLRRNAGARRTLAPDNRFPAQHLDILHLDSPFSLSLPFLDVVQRNGRVERNPVPRWVRVKVSRDDAGVRKGRDELRGAARQRLLVEQKRKPGERTMRTQTATAPTATTTSKAFPHRGPPSFVCHSQSALKTMKSTGRKMATRKEV